MPRSRDDITADKQVLWTRSPSEFFIRYSLTKDQEGDLVDLARKLGNLKILLPENAVEYLTMLDKEFQELSPDPFEPEDLRHTKSQKYLLDAGIWDMWHPNRAMRQASEIFLDSAHRDHVSALLTSGFNSGQIVKLLSNRFGATYLEESIARFQHYYWNTSLLTWDEHEELYRRARAGSVIMGAHLSGKTVAGKMTTLRKLGHDTAETSPQRMWQAMAGEVMSSLALIESVPLTRKSTYLAELASALTAVTRGIAESQQSEQEAAISLVKQLNLTSRPSDSVPLSVLKAKGFTPKSLPGRGDLEVIDTVEKEGVHEVARK